MFTEVSKLFDRDFVIGYFVAAATLLVANLFLLDVFGASSQPISLDRANMLTSTSVLIVIAWLVAVCLLAVNRDIFRFMQGYWPFELGKRLNWIERRRFQSLKNRIGKLNDDYKVANSQERKVAVGHSLDCLQLLASKRFPDSEVLVLPTSFGNTVRAFEVYPRIMYGYEAIQGWSRLQAVIPKEYCDLMNAARATTDLWVNLWFVSILVALEYISFVIYNHELRSPFAPLVAATIGFLSYYRARAAVAPMGRIGQGCIRCIPAGATRKTRICHTVGPRGGATDVDEIQPSDHIRVKVFDGRSTERPVLPAATPRKQ